VSEMAFTGGLGALVDLEAVPVDGELRVDYLLFSESNGRLLVEVRPDQAGEFEAAMGDSVHAQIGSVTGSDAVSFVKDGEAVIQLPLAELMAAEKTPLEVPRR